MAAHSPPRSSVTLSLLDKSIVVDAAPAPVHRPPTWLETILAATLVFNLVDVVFTLAVVLAGLAVEANPVMDKVLAAGPVAFALVKLSVVSGGVMLLWHEYRRPLAIAGSVGVFAAYGLLMLYHAHWLVALVA